MLQVDSSLFGNLIASIQRTSRLTGGSVSGLPGGVIIDGLQGVSSFGSDIAEAQKEFELGRVRQSLERIKQVEMQFNGISGRWASTVNQVISSARQGRQQLPAQKLNEVKSAQSKMQQLTSPVTKSFRDLVSALEHAVTQEGYEERHGDDDEGIESPDPMTSPTESIEDQASRWVGEHHDDLQLASQLKLKKGDDKKTRVTPAFAVGQRYVTALTEQGNFFSFRVEELHRQSLAIHHDQEDKSKSIDAAGIKAMITRGVWLLK